MSGSYRHVGVALAGLAALACAAGIGAYWGSLYSPDKKQYETVGNGQAAYGEYQGVTGSLPEMAGIPEPIERAIANPAPDSGQDHEQRDLAAQEAMSVWGFWMALAAMGTLVVTSGGTLLIWQQVRLTRKAVEDTGEATEAMREQNKIAKDTAKRQLRAYITASDPKASGLKAGEIPQIEVKLVNSGQTPARITKFHMFTGFGSLQFDTSPETMPIEEGPTSRSQLGAGDRFTTDCKTLGPLDEDAAFYAERDLYLYSWGYMFYEDIFEEEHRTYFRVMSRDGTAEITFCHEGNTCA